MTFQEKRTYAILLSDYRKKQDENICWQIEKATFFILSGTKVKNNRSLKNGKNKRVHIPL